MEHKELQGHLQHPFNRFSKQRINVVLEFSNYLLNYDLILQEFKVTYIIHGIIFCFYHKSHTEQPFLLSGMRTCSNLLEAARLGNKYFSLSMSWDEGGQQHWVALSPLGSSLFGSRTGFSCLRTLCRTRSHGE